MRAGQPTACILYGFCEGPHVARRFQRKLTAKGYAIITDPEQADLIIAHSGGCLLLPDHVRAKQIIHIGPYSQTSSSLVAAIGRKLVHDLRTHHTEGELHFWTRKTFWNIVYFWNMPHNIRMLRNLASGRHWRYSERTIIVRPRFDMFSAPDFSKLAGKHPTFVSISGHHDDCWRDPAPYLALIK